MEIWGWEKREGMERLEERYLRWLMGVGPRTPGYMVREELQREKLRGRAGRRVWGYERLEEGTGERMQTGNEKVIQGRKDSIGRREGKNSLRKGG